MSLRQNWRNNIPSPIRQSLKRPLRGGRLSEFGSAALRATLAAAVLTGAMGLSQTVEAVGIQISGPDYSAGGNNAKAGQSTSIAIGHEADASGKGTIVIGEGSVVTNSIAVNYDSDKYDYTGVSKTTAGGGDDILQSVVIGTNSWFSPKPYGFESDVGKTESGVEKDFNSGGQGVAIGSEVVTTSQATAVGNNVFALGRSSIAIGSDDTSEYPQKISTYDAKTYFSHLYPAIDSTGSRYGFKYENGEATIVKQDKVQYSPTLAQGDGAIAIGSRSIANAGGATALGTLAFALQKGSTAIGTLTRAEGVGALAFGNNTYVFADNSIAVGSKSQVLNIGGTAYGYKTYSAGDNSIAIGRDVYANVSMTGQKDGTRAVFTDKGKYNFDPTKGARSILDGTSLADLGATGMLLSGESNGSITYDQALEKLVAKDPSNADTVGMGFLTANTAEKNGVANVITTSGKNALVIGSRSVATGSNGISLGRGAISLADNSFALGSYSMSTNKNSIAMGLASRTTGDNSLAIGTAAATMGNNSLSIGAGTINYGTNTTVVGTRSGVVDKVKNSVILGSKGIIGKGVQSSLAIGTNASVGNYLVNDEDLIVRLDPNTGNLPINPQTKKPYTAAEYANLLSTQGYDKAKEITGIETNRSFMAANADDNGNGLVNAIAIGNNARVYSKSTGTNLYTAANEREIYEGKVLATEDGRNAMAIGNGAQAWLENSLALGVNSKTDYTPKQLAAEAWRTPDAIAVSTTSKVGVISVGSVGNERRIVNLAAGAYDTDAVNVSQLKQMYDTIQRQVNGGDDLQGLHYLSTKSGTIASGETDYVMKNNAQVAYTRYVNTLKEYKSYLLKEAFGGAQLTEEAKKGYNDELTKLEARLVENGVSRETLDNNLKIRTYTKSDQTVVTTDTINRNPETHAITGITVNKAAMGDNVTVTDAINALEGNLETDLGVLDNNNNAITGLTSDAIEQGLNSINYNNSLATGKGSVAIGYKTAASSDYSTAIGAEALASGATDAGLGATAVGAKSKATARNTLAVGQGAAATRENALALGVSANVKGGSMAVGNWTEIPNADSTNSVAVGQGAKLYGDVDESVTVGAYSRIGDEASTSTRTITGATSVGSNSVVAGDGGTAIGHRTNIALTASNATAIGKEASVAQDKGVAIGYQSVVRSNEDLGVGITYSTLNPDYTSVGVESPTTGGVVSVGSTGQTRRIVNVAAGKNWTDAVNLGQLQSLADQKVILYADVDNNREKGIAGVLGDPVNASYGGPNFTLTGKVPSGQADIQTEAIHTAEYPSIRFTLNKVDTITDGETRVATTNAVHDALITAKPTIAQGTGVTVSQTAGTDIAGDTWTINVDTADVAKKVNIAYKASGETSTNSTTATTGFTFTPTGGTTGLSDASNVKLSTATGGVVNVGLSNTLSGITSVGGASEQGKITFGDSNNISFNNATLTNFTDSKGNTGATVASTKEVAAAKTEVKAGTNVTVVKTEGTDKNPVYTVSVSATGLADSLGDVYAKKDASNLVTGTGTKTSTLSPGQQADWRTAINVYSKGDVDTKITNVNNSISTINSNLNHTIALTGDTSTNSNAQKLSEGNVAFAVKGAANSGISTTTTTDGLTIDIAKNGTIADGDKGIVTGGTVYTAMEGAKTTVESVDTTGSITVTQDSTVTDHNHYKIGFDAGKLAAAVTLKYKANSTGEQEVLLSDGLDFTDTDNLTASVEADGVVKYTLKDALTGVNSITAGTGKDLSFTANGTTAKVTADGIDLSSNKTVKGLRKAAANGEAVEYSQFKTLKDKVEGTDGNGGILANTIKVEGNTATGTAVGKKLTDNPVFTIVGDGTDLTSATNAAGVTFTLNKVDSITEGTKESPKVATTKAVYNAITGAKTTVAVNPATNGILKLSATESTNLTGNAYTLSVDTAKLTESLTTDFAKKDASNIDPATWRNELNVYQKSEVYNTTQTYNKAGTDAAIAAARTVVEAATGQTMLTVTKDDNVTAYNKYTVGINTDVLSQNVELAYKADDGTAKNVKLSDGLDFTSTDNLTASVENNGVVKYTLKNALTGINSITGNGKKITFGENGIDMGGAQLKNLANGNAPTDAVTKQQLDGVQTTAETAQATAEAAGNYSISLKGDTHSTTNTKSLKTNPVFAISANSADVVTTTTTSGVSIGLNPLGTISNTDGTKNRVVSSSAVYNALLAAKPSVGVKAGEFLTIDGEKDGATITGDTFTIGLNKAALIDEIKGDIQASQGTPITRLRYGANLSSEDYAAHTGMSSVNADNGLNFLNGTNTTVTTATNGQVKYSLNDTLTGIKSIAGVGENAAKMTFGDATTGQGNTVTFNDTKVTGLADGASAKDAVNYGQLQKLATGIGVGVDGKPGTDGKVGPAGKDGLDGQNGTTPQSLIQKVAALRSGTAGNMVYTIANDAGVQERLVLEGGQYYRSSDLHTEDYARAIDGKWYAKGNINPDTGLPQENAVAIDFASHVLKTGKQALTKSQYGDINISTVNPNGTVTSRTPILNVESGLGIDSSTVLDLQGVKAKQLITDSKTGLYRFTGDKLNQAATLGDLKALGLAGIDVAANGGLDTDDSNVPKSTYHVNLGGPVSIKGGATFDDTKVVSQTEFSGKNIVTAVAEDGNSVNILMKSTPEFTGVILGEPEVKEGSTVTTPSKQVTLTTDGANKVVFTGDNSKDNKVVLSGLKDDLADTSSAVTRGSLNELKDQLGLKGDTGAAGVAGDTGAAGVNGSQGPAGKDGLDRFSILDKVEAQREGLSGNMVYTDPNGGRVVKVGTAYYNKDAFNTYITEQGLKQDPVSGKWYKADQFDASTGKLKAGATGGKTVAQVAEALKADNSSALVENVKISAVNTDGSTTSPIIISNVKSTFTLEADNAKADVTTAKNVLNGDKEAANGTADKTGLLNLTGPALANAATVGELQAVAQAGLDFTGDTVDTSGNKLVAHAPLGSTVAIVGGGYNSTTKDSYDTKNVATFVDATNKTITVKMKKTPTFEGLTLSQGTLPNDSTVKLTPTGTGEGTKLTVANGSNNPIVLTGLKGDDKDGSSAVTVDQLKAATAGLNGIGANGIDGKAGPAGKDGLNGQDLGTQIIGLRSGNSGPMVYTIDKSGSDKTQTRLLTHDGKYYRASDVTNYKLVDGKWYPADKVTENNQVEEGTPSVSLATVVTGLEALNSDDLKKVNISAVGADGSITETTVLKNIASGWTTRDTVGVGTTTGEEATGLYALKDTDLTQAATLGDLQKVAKAGLTFSGNSKDDNGKYITTTRALNETLAIKGGIELGNGVTESDLSSQNLYTKVDAASGEIFIQMRTAPEFTSVILGANSDVKLTATGDKATFSKITEPTGNVVLNGLKDDVKDDTSAVTRGAFNKLADALGIKGDTGATGATGAQGIAGVNGTNGAAGPAGQDGMNGYSIPAKVEAQREGLTGNMVYTAKEDGARLAKVDKEYYKQSDLNALVAGKKQAYDGKWYDAAKVKDDGTLQTGVNADEGKTVSELVKAAVDAKKLTKVETADVQISTVSPQDGTTTTATTIANVESNLASATPDVAKLNSENATEKAAEEARIADVARLAMVGTNPTKENPTLAESGLLNASGDVLNNAATVGDLQTVAQAGMFFKTNDAAGNTTDPVHVPLGNQLSIIGKDGAKYSGTAYSADNLVTTVTTDGKVQVAMSNSPKFKSMTLGDAYATFVRTPGGNGKLNDSDDVGTLMLSFQKGDEAGTGVNTVVVQGITTGTNPSSAVTKGYVDNILTGGLTISAPVQSRTKMPSDMDGFNQASMSSQLLAARNGVSGPVVYTAENGERVMRVTLLEKDGSGNYIVPNQATVIKTAGLAGYKLATTQDGKTLGWYNGTETGIWLEVPVKGLDGTTSKVPTNNLGYTYLKDGSDVSVAVKDETELARYLKMDPETVTGRTPAETEALRAFVTSLKSSVLTKDIAKDNIVDGNVVLSLVDTLGNTVAEGGDPKTTPMVLRNMASDVAFTGETITTGGETPDNAAAIAYKDGVNAKKFTEALTGLPYNDLHLDSSATVSDIRYLAKAGLEFTTNDEVKEATEEAQGIIHKNVGERLAIIGDETFDPANTTDTYSADNLITTITDAGALQIQMKETPTFKGLTLDNGESGDDNAKVTLTPTVGTDKDDKPVNVLTLGNGVKGESDKESPVEIRGLQGSEELDGAVTYGQLKDYGLVGMTQPKDGAAGPAGQNGQKGADGLNGASITEQAMAQRAGVSGNFVYTTLKGQDNERLVAYKGDYIQLSKLSDFGTTYKQHNDGMWYKEGSTEGMTTQAVLAEIEKNDTTGQKLAGAAVSKDQIAISAVNPDTADVNGMITLNNIKSGLERADYGNKISPKDAKELVAGVPKTDTSAGKTGLLDMAGKATLGKAATLGDLQAVAQAGLDFTGNSKTDNKVDTLHAPLSSTVKIEGGSAYNETDFSATNLSTQVDAANSKILITMKKRPTFESLILGNDVDGKVTVAPEKTKDADGKDALGLNLSTEGAEKVVLGGLTDGQADDTAVTKGTFKNLKDTVDKLNSALNGGDGSNGAGGSDGSGTTGSTGAAGKDGLDGKGLIDQVQGLRDGLGGTMVYTDKDGNRLIREGSEFYKANDLVKYGDNYYSAEEIAKKGLTYKDGKFYKGDVEAAGPDKPTVQQLAKNSKWHVKAEDVQISSVNPEEGSTTDPTVIGNVKSTIGLDGLKQAVDKDGKPIMEANGPIDEAAAKKAVGTNGLLGKKGVDLNRIATVGDLQAVAQAGLDFTGNTLKDGKGFHTTLSSTVAIKGGVDNYDDTISPENIATKVTDKGLEIGMKKAPSFTGLTLKGEDGKDGQNGLNGSVQIGVAGVNGKDGKDGMIITFSGKDGKDGVAGKDGKVVISGVETGTAGDSVVTKEYVEKVIDGIKGTNGTNGLNGSDGSNGTNGSGTGTAGQNGPAGADSLNGQPLGAQVLAGRDGLSGTMVYTDGAGNRLVRDGNTFYTADSMKNLVKVGDKFYDKANVPDVTKVKEGNDGKLYNVTDLNDDGTLKNPDTKPVAAESTKKPTKVDPANAIISAANAKDGSTKTPTAIGNVKSVIGLDGFKQAVDKDGKALTDEKGNPIMEANGPIGEEAAQKAVAGDAKDGNGGLLAAKGATLNRVATVGDLQAVAQAGLDFTANAGANEATVHRALGTELSIKGGNTATWDASDKGGNLMTYADGTTITVAMKQSPVFKSIVIGGNPITGEAGKDGKDGVTLGSDGNGNLTVNNNVVLTGDKNGALFNVTDGKTTKGIKIGDTITFKDYLEVISGGDKTDTGNSDSGNTGGSDNTGNTGNTGATTDKEPAATINVKDLVSKSDFVTTINNINNKIDKINNLDLSKLQPNGTIGTGQESDLQAVSGETVKDYLDKNYTNNAVLNQRLTKLSKQANAGTASAMAAAAIPQVTNMYDDNLMIGAGTGVYGGESAVAIGVSGTNDNRDRTYRISTTYDSTGKWGLSAGIGFSIGSGKNTPKPSVARALSERVDRLEAENKALRETNQTEIKDLAAKNDQLQKQVQELQAMLKQLVPQVQAAKAANATTQTKTADEDAEQPAALAPATH